MILLFYFALYHNSLKQTIVKSKKNTGKFLKGEEKVYKGTFLQNVKLLEMVCAFK